MNHFFHCSVDNVEWGGLIKQEKRGVFFQMDMNQTRLLISHNRFVSTRLNILWKILFCLDKLNENITLTSLWVVFVSTIVASDWGYTATRIEILHALQILMISSDNTSKLIKHYASWLCTFIIKFHLAFNILCSSFWNSVYVRIAIWSFCLCVLFFIRNICDQGQSIPK